PRPRRAGRARGGGGRDARRGGGPRGGGGPHRRARRRSDRVIERGARVVIQGATGREARMVVRHMLAYGTPVAAGVTPGRGGEEVEGVPVHDSVEDAVAAGGPIAASLVSVPPAATLDAACEALAAGVGLLVVATENVPRLDAARLVARAREHGATVVGPNSVGLIRPGERMKLGAIGGDDADRAFAPGPV